MSLILFSFVLSLTRPALPLRLSLIDDALLLLLCLPLCRVPSPSSSSLSCPLVSQVNKQQLQAVKERFLAFLNGETQIVADEAFCNAVRSYYEVRAVFLSAQVNPGVRMFWFGRWEHLKGAELWWFVCFTSFGFFDVCFLNKVTWFSNFFYVKGPKSPSGQNFKTMTRNTQIFLLNEVKNCLFFSHCMFKLGLIAWIFFWGGNGTFRRNW